MGTSEIAVLVALDANHGSTGLAFLDGHDRMSGESAEFEKSCLRVEAEIGMQQGHLLLAVTRDRMYGVICSKLRRRVWRNHARYRR